jgi:hypothetical protein
MKVVYNTNFREKKERPIMNNIEDLLCQVEELTQRVKRLEIDLAYAQKSNSN